MLVDMSKGRSRVSGKWVLKIKRGPTGEIERYKARYVAGRFTQGEGVDCFETWAPVESYATQRVVCSIAAEEDLEMKHVDIQCAFLNGRLEERAFVSPPPTFLRSHGSCRRLCMRSSRLPGNGTGSLLVLW